MDRFKKDELVAKDAEIKYLKEEITRLSKAKPNQHREPSTFTAVMFTAIYCMSFLVFFIYTKSGLAAEVLAVSVVYALIGYEKQ